mgnify:CR=1 FL=1
MQTCGRVCVHACESATEPSDSSSRSDESSSFLLQRPASSVGSRGPLPGTRRENRKKKPPGASEHSHYTSRSAQRSVRAPCMTTLHQRRLCGGNKQAQRRHALGSWGSAIVCRKIDRLSRGDPISGRRSAQKTVVGRSTGVRRGGAKMPPAPAPAPHRSNAPPPLWESEDDEDVDVSSDSFLESFSQVWKNGPR